MIQVEDCPHATNTEIDKHQTRVCCLCLTTGKNSEQTQIKNGRLDVLQDVCKTVKVKTDHAHYTCLERLGLAKAPKSKQQRAHYPEVFRERLTEIVQKNVQDVLESANENEDTPILHCKIMDRLFADLPIKRPTNTAIEDMKKLVSHLLEKSGKPPEFFFVF